MAAFTVEEVEALGRTTNRDFNAKWVARWNPSEMPQPNGASDDQRRMFLNAKYVEKRWCSDAGGGRVGAAPAPVAAAAPSAPKAESPFQSAPQPAQGNPFADAQGSGCSNPFAQQHRCLSNSRICSGNNRSRTRLDSNRSKMCLDSNSNSRT